LYLAKFLDTLAKPFFRVEKKFSGNLEPGLKIISIKRRYGFINALMEIYGNIL